MSAFGRKADITIGHVNAEFNGDKRPTPDVQGRLFFRPASLTRLYSTWRKRASYAPDVRFWPFVSVKLSVNVPNRNVGFAPESGRSECAC